MAGQLPVVVRFAKFSKHYLSTGLTVCALQIGSMLVMSSAALAQAAAPTGEPAPMLMQVVPFVVILGFMYFTMIRPQMRKQKEHQSFLSQLTRGTEVVTSSGILGRVEGLTDTFVTLEIAPDVRIRVLRSSVLSSAKSVMTTGAEVKA